MTTNIKTLLTSAAKAAGIEGTFFDYGDNSGIQPEFTNSWKPHLDDGDSARLRTALEIDVKWKDTSVVLYSTDPLGWQEFYADHNGDKNAALRMATLRLAAEIGRRMRTGEILTQLAQEAQKDGLYD